MATQVKNKMIVICNNDEIAIFTLSELVSILDYICKNQSKPLVFKVGDKDEVEKLLRTY